MSLKEQVEIVAQRVNGVEVGIDPLTVVTILTTVIPMLADCFKGNDDVSASEVQSRIVALNKKDRKRLIRRTTDAVLREHRREEKKKPKDERVSLSVDDARVMAVAIIDQAIEEDAGVITNAVFECDGIVGAND